MAPAGHPPRLPVNFTTKGGITLSVHYPPPEACGNCGIKTNRTIVARHGDKLVKLCNRCAPVFQRIEKQIFLMRQKNREDALRRAAARLGKEARP